jgi:hypothetical protein
MSVLTQHSVGSEIVLVEVGGYSDYEQSSGDEDDSEGEEEDEDETMERDNNVDEAEGRIPKEPEGEGIWNNAHPTASETLAEPVEAVEEGNKGKTEDKTEVEEALKDMESKMVVASSPEPETRNINSRIFHVHKSVLCQTSGFSRQQQSQSEKVRNPGPST